MNPESRRENRSNDGRGMATAPHPTPVIQCPYIIATKMIMMVTMTTAIMIIIIIIIITIIVIMIIIRPPSPES